MKHLAYSSTVRSGFQGLIPVPTVSIRQRRVGERHNGVDGWILVAKTGNDDCKGLANMPIEWSQRNSAVPSVLPVILSSPLLSMFISLGEV